MEKRKDFYFFIICFIIETCIIFSYLNYYNRKECNQYNEKAYIYLEDIARKIESDQANVLSLPKDITSEISTKGKYVYVTLSFEELVIPKKSLLEKIACANNKVNLHLLFDSKGNIITMKREFDSQEYMSDFLYVYAIFLSCITTFLTWIILLVFKPILKSSFPRVCIN